MENQNIILKLSRLFPSSFSSCHQLRAVTADVAESSISIAKTKKIPHNDDSDRSKPTKGPKCPRPPPPFSSLELKKNHLTSASVKSCNNNNSQQQVSSSSNSGFFSSSTEDDEKVKKDDAFFSLSSNSGDSFRLTSRRLFREETTVNKMKTIKEKERCSSFSSAKTSFDLTNNTASSKKEGDKKKKKNYCCNNNAAKKLLGQENNNWVISASDDHRDYYYGNKKVSNVVSARRKTRVKKRISSLGSSMGSVLIEESRAVEKKSMDPRSDFRASMVEMIVEKQMVSARDLERLLLCFLSLNDASYHEMIFEVFSEICETLFSN